MTFDLATLVQPATSKILLVVLDGLARHLSGADGDGVRDGRWRARRIRGDGDRRVDHRGGSWQWPGCRGAPPGAACGEQQQPHAQHRDRREEIQRISNQKG